MTLIHQNCIYEEIMSRLNFIDPEGSLPCSQEPSTGPYPEPDQSGPYHLSKIHFT
jgi:hypothetical protein